MSERIIYLEIFPKNILIELVLNYSNKFNYLICEKYPIFCKNKNFYQIYKVIPKENINQCRLCKEKNTLKLSQLRQVLLCFNLKTKIFCYKCPENKYIFDSMLRVINSIILAKSNGLILHSAGVVKYRSCELYPGPTNSGKSTLAKRIDSKKILSDELCPVAVKGNKVVSWRSLFYSEVLPNSIVGKEFVVDDIKFLIKKKNQKEFTINYLSIKSISTKLAIKLLLKNIFWVTKDISFSKDILESVFKVVKILQRG